MIVALFAGLTLLGGDDRLEARVALAGDARLDELDRRDRRAGSSSASVAFSSTASEVAPAGGTTITCRIFSEPALMNWVGRSGTSASDATNRTPAPARTPDLVQRLRRAKVMTGVYDAHPDRALRLAMLVDRERDLSMNRYARTGTTVSATISEASSANVTVRANGQEELADEAADEAERQEHARRSSGCWR